MQIHRFNRSCIDLIMKCNKRNRVKIKENVIFFEEISGKTYRVIFIVSNELPFQKDDISFFKRFDMVFDS